MPQNKLKLQKQLKNNKKHYIPKKIKELNTFFVHNSTSVFFVIINKISGTVEKTSTLNFF